LSLVQSRSDTARWHSDHPEGDSERERDLDGFAHLWVGYLAQDVGNLPALAATGCSFPGLGGGYGVADLVVGRCLIEMKTVFDPAAAMDNWLNQVLAYVLFDWSDAPGVGMIAAYLGWQTLLAEPSLVVLASAPSRNNPVRGCPIDWRGGRDACGLGLRPEPPPEQASRFLGHGEVTSL
jgi:hypothetical protein